MNIWLINQSFRPETNAPANRFHALTEYWKSFGQQVRVLTGQPYRPHGKLAEGYDGKTRQEEREGITIVRHREIITRKKTALAQAVSQLFLMCVILFKNLHVPPEQRPGVIIASSPDFFPVMAGWLLAVRYRVPFVMEVRDLWPEIFEDMGVLSNRFLLWLLRLLALFMYHRAAAVVTVTQGYAEQLLAKGVAADKVFVIPNAVADAELEVMDSVLNSHAGESLRSELHLNPLTKVVLYIGNHGKAQALGQIIDAARLLVKRSDIQFILVGDGADKKRLESLASGVPNVQFFENQPKDKVWAFYAMCTVSLSCLRNIPSFATTVPSKIFEIMAAQTPLVACVQGEAARLVEQSGGGVVVPPEEPDKLAAALTSLIDAPERRESMKKAGRAFVDKQRRYSVLAKQYLGILQKVTGR
jgi:hypothetical protein